jgi:hypothetical protein
LRARGSAIQPRGHFAVTKIRQISKVLAKIEYRRPLCVCISNIWLCAWNTATQGRQPFRKHGLIGKVLLPVFKVRTDWEE